MLEIKVEIVNDALLVVCKMNFIGYETITVHDWVRFSRSKRVTFRIYNVDLCEEANRTIVSYTLTDKRPLKEINVVTVVVMSPMKNSLRSAFSCFCLSCNSACNLVLLLGEFGHR